ncbi:MAG: SH3 domain-containing protein [Alphaproteobacteria bacterium]
MSQSVVTANEAGRARGPSPARHWPKASRIRVGLAAAAIVLAALPGCASNSAPPVQTVDGDGAYLPPRNSANLRPTIEDPLQGIDTSLRLSVDAVEALAGATGAAVIHANTQAEVPWTSVSGTRGLIEVGAAFFAGLQDMHGDPLRVPVTLASAFQIIPTQERGVTRVNANVRNGPGTDYKRLDTLPGGTPLNILGQVGASDWVIVAQGTQGIGYMFRPLIVTSEVAPLSSDALIAQGVAIDLTGENPLPRGYTDEQLDRLLLGGAVRRPLMCRDLRHTVFDTGGSAYRWAATACRTKPLTWRVIDTGVPRNS